MLSEYRRSGVPGWIDGGRRARLPGLLARVGVGAVGARPALTALTALGALTAMGAVLTCTGSAGAISQNPDWTFESDQNGARLIGAFAGDVTGEGYGELILASHEWGTEAGLVWMAFGSASGPGAEPMPMIQGPNNSDLGYAVASAGDTNNDGRDDVIIGAPNHSNGQLSEGHARVYLGIPTGLPDNPAWTREFNQVGAGFGQAVACAGDVNNDGRDDILVGSPYADGGQTDEGLAYLFLGTASGPAPDPAWIGDSDVAGSRFGWTVAGAGDVNGDGKDDFLVGAPEYTNGQSQEGCAYLFHGGSIPSSNPAWSIEGNVAGARFGHSVSGAGDVNGDGFHDVLVGAQRLASPEEYEGRVYLYLGGPSGLSTTPFWTFEPNVASSFCGSSVTSGDLNGDGYSDLIFGAQFFSGTTLREGAVWVFRGAPSGPPTLLWHGTSGQGESQYGWFVSAGDTNGDDVDDLIVTAYMHDQWEVDEGKVFVYFGEPATTDVEDAPSPAFGMLPVSARLRVIGANPFREGTALRLDLAGARASSGASDETWGGASDGASDGAMGEAAGGPTSEEHGSSCLEIFDVRGARVATVAPSEWSPGSIEYRWTGRDPREVELPAGLYFARVRGAQARVVKLR